MAGNDYNPIGGTSQSTITKYHMQMADIDRQLYETGKYTGPVPDLKKGVVETKTLERKEAQQLKNLLWYQADKLEGYNWSERHARKWYEKLAQGIAGFFKLFNIPYQIKRLRAQKLYEQAAGNVYQNESLYEMAAAIAGTQAENSQEEQQGQENKQEKDKKKEKDQKKEQKNTKDKEFDPTKAKSPASNQKEGPDQENKAQDTPEQNTQPSDQQDVQTPGEDNTKPEPQSQQDKYQKYKEKFYQNVTQLTDQGMSKEDAMIQLINQNPVTVYNIEQQDMTPKMAAHAIMATANSKGKEPNEIMLHLVRNVPSIIQADQKLDHALDSLFKIIPTAIEHNPETLRYIQPNQIKPKTIEYTLNDIRSHKGEQGVEAFLSFVNTLDSPGAVRFRELIDTEQVKAQPQTPTAPETPQVPPQTPPMPPQTPPMPQAPQAPPQMPPTPPQMPPQTPPQMPPQTPPMPPQSDIPPQFSPAPEEPEIPVENISVYDASIDPAQDDVPSDIEEFSDNPQSDIQSAIEEIQRNHPEIENWPDAEYREQVTMEYLMQEHPEFYPQLDLNNRTLDSALTLSAIAVMYDIEQLINCEAFYTEAICDKITEIASTKTVEELEIISNNVHDTNKVRVNSDVEMIAEAVEDVIKQKTEKTEITKITEEHTMAH